MTRFKKVAVTIPDETYKALEKARARLGKTRSDAISVALVDWLNGLESTERDRRYVAGYLRIPESSEIDPAVAVATADWSSWEAGPPSKAAEPRARRR